MLLRQNVTCSLALNVPLEILPHLAQNQGKGVIRFLLVLESQLDRTLPRYKPLGITCSLVYWTHSENQCRKLATFYVTFSTVATNMYVVPPEFLMESLLISCLCTYKKHMLRIKM